MGKKPAKSATKPTGRQISQAPTESHVPKEKFAAWERKVDRLHKKNVSQIMRGWLSYIPQIHTPGCAPQEGLDTIADLISVYPRVKGDGEVTENLSGARPTVLHEALYWAHKAIHVEVSCSEALIAGRHTWAIVDAYQASLFALASILGFLGYTVERHDSNFILIDVWANAPTKKSKNTSFEDFNNETCQLIRFKTLDHFHKWAILQRVLRTLSVDSDQVGLTSLVQLINNALEPHESKDFARYRNDVNYKSRVWLSNDLIKNNPSGPIQPANSPQEIFNEIYNGSPTGTIYLMCALVELACKLAQGLEKSHIIKQELACLSRRDAALKVICKFKWEDHFAN